MRRALFFFAKLALVVALAVWLANRPGEATIVWMGREIHMQVGILIAVLLVLAVVVALGWQLWRWLARSPRQIARGRAEGRRRKGYKALTQGMAAVAAGDPDEARRQASRAAVLLNEPPLTLLLAAQAAQLNGDEQAAHKYFTAMLDRPETRFLGLRGLLTQALKSGDSQAALAYAGDAHRERPSAAWATKTLLDLQLKNGDWSAAEATLKEAARQKTIAPDTARRQRAVILAERARDGVAALSQGGGSIVALDAAREAVKLAPDLVPARALLARLLASGGNEKAAAKAIEQGWAQTPHPALAAAYAGLRPDEDPVARVRRFEKLAALNPRHRESHLAVAEAALAAGLWGEGRSHLAAVAETEPAASAGGNTARLCRLMARLEEGERGDPAAVRRWLMMAAEAPADPAWTCDRCGTPAGEWQARCSQCGAFDSLVWRAAPQRTALALAPLPLAPLADPAAAPLARIAGAASGGAGVVELDEAQHRAPPAAAGDDEAGAGVDAARLVN
jgi:HemY protein